MVRAGPWARIPSVSAQLAMWGGGGRKGTELLPGPTWQILFSVFSERWGLCSERTECRDKLKVQQTLPGDQWSGKKR